MSDDAKSLQERAEKVFAKVGKPRRSNAGRKPDASMLALKAVIMPQIAQGKSARGLWEAARKARPPLTDVAYSTFSKYVAKWTREAEEAAGKPEQPQGDLLPGQGRKPARAPAPRPETQAEPAAPPEPPATKTRRKGSKTR